ncbi:hypothetical protein [Aquariibacter albus]|uniref:Uncharacterized protein n=1 Tax=Aquariibacter albus TaxID=2759899 RepID=A0A839HIZ2_9BURK|nr:hypothetical protein [Aquariibacter albus]MBB1161496.1 hypothetical protein [Aquariibacter albus]
MSLNHQSPRRDELTYRHPRTLVEAFGPDARTACAIETPSDDALGAAKALTHWLCVLSMALTAALVWVLA